MMSGESVAFDRAAGYYDRTRGFPPGVERSVAEMIVRVGGLTPTSRVLEIGIGTGRIALPVAPYVKAYYGVDLALPMIERLFDKCSVEPVYPVLADATRLPFADQTFDAVIAVHIFHLIPPYREALKEAARILKPDGVLIHGWNNRDVDDAIDKVWNAATAASANIAGAVPFEERRTLLPANGWRLKSDDTYQFSVERTPARYLESLRSRLFSSCWSMPDDVLERGIAAVEAHLAEQDIDPEMSQTIQSAFHVQTFLPPG